VAAGTLLLLFLPFLLSLLGRGGRAICLASSIFALLMSVEPYGAVMPWVFGMTVAGVTVWERVRQRWPV
jgi:hypothetical protein